MEHSFDADESVIPCIAHLKSINAFGMLVRADCVGDLVMRHLGEAALKRRSKYIGKWRFTLDEKLTEPHMR
ncbi:hypothetical protein PRIPAC_74183, partial [Pristionchus pacificus]|uniref:Uncharacterized protein n=1 Tax=Pristionchus pacificus TaxID=54126 RepID=A0A2A6C0S0_PRIPA